MSLMVLVSSLITKLLDLNLDLEKMLRNDSIISFAIFSSHTSISCPKQLWKSLIPSSGCEEGACNSSALAMLHIGQDLPCSFFFKSGVSMGVRRERDVSVGEPNVKMLVSDSLECLWIYLFSKRFILNCKIQFT